MDPYDHKLIERLAALRAPQAPPDLRLRVLDAIRGGVVRKRLTARSLVGATAGALALAAAITLWISGSAATPETESATHIARVALSGVRETMNSEDEAPLRQWFAERFDHPFDIPDITGAHLVRGHIARADGVDGAVIEFEYHGAPLTFVMTSDRGSISGLEQNRPSISETVDGREVVLWHEDGTTRAVIAKMPRQELERIADMCRRKSLS
jgi:anti-sigma factor RsiW